MELRSRVVIFITFLLSLTATILISASIATDWWFQWEAKECNRTVTDHRPSHVHSGLFYGERQLDEGCLGLRFNEIYVRDEMKIDRSFYTMWIWISVIIAAALGILWSIVGLVFSLVNTVIKPIETITGPLGLYVWNSLGLLCTFVCGLLFTIDYFISVRKNVNKGNPRAAQWGDVTMWLDYSFWLLIGAVAAFAINLVLLLLNGMSREKRPIEEKVDPMQLNPEVMIF